MADEATNQETYFQFYGAVDIPKTQYREFRVRTETLADIPASQCTSKTLSDGIKNATDEHNQAILELKKQIREHEELNTKWQQLKKLPDGSTKDLVYRLLQSGKERIQQFEEDNFRSNNDWTRTKKATDGVHLKSMLSSLNEIDGDGNPVIRREEEEAKSEKVTSALTEKSINGEDSKIALEPVPKIDGVETETSKPEDSGRNDHAMKIGVEKKEDQRKDSPIEKSMNVKQDQTHGNQNKATKTATPTKKDTPTANHGQSSSMETPQPTGNLPVLNSNTPSTEEEAIVSSLDSPNETPPVSKNFELCEELMKHWHDPAVSEVVDTNTVAEKKKVKILKATIEALTALLDPPMFANVFEVDNFRAKVRRHAVSRYQMADIQEQDEESEDQLGPLVRGGSSSIGNGNIRIEESERNGTEDSAAEDEEIAEVNDSDNTQSEKSFHTAKTSVSPDSAEHEKLDESVNAPSTSSSCPGPSSNKKRKGKKPKRSKKCNKGPKITQEEVEAIKKQKKAEADREFARLENERKAHLKKVENSEKSKLFRQSVQTALDMGKAGPMPPEVDKVEDKLKEFIEGKNLEDLIKVRNEYLQKRPREFAENLTGTELAVKMELLEIYQHELERAYRLCQYFMFLTILDEKSYDYSDFEFAILRYYFVGCEEEMGPNVQEVFRRFDHFVKDSCPSVPQYDQFINAVIYVREKLMLLSDMATRYNITRSEVILREGYCGIAHVFQNVKKITEMLSFLETSRDSTTPSFNFIEAWILETKVPTAYSCDV